MMKRIRMAVSAALLMFSTQIAPSASAESPALDSNAARLNLIRKTIDDYKTAGEKISDPDVKSSILADIAAKGLKLDPKGKIEQTSQKEMTDAANKAVDEKFSESEKSVRKKAEAEAKKLFAVAQMKDKISIKYKRGNYIYDANGIYYGIFGNTIKIADKTIPIIDILPESQAMFDVELCESKRKAHVEEALKDYAKRKKAAFSEIYEELRGKQERKNLANGYVFLEKDKTWCSPRTAVEKLLESAVAPTPEKARPAVEAEEPKAPPAKTPEPVEKAPVEAVKKPQAQAPAKVEEPVKTEAPKTSSPEKDAQYLKELKAAIEAKMTEIANTCSGIDADQGFKTGGQSVLWGLQRKDVQLLLTAEGVKLTPGENSDVISFENGPIREVELYYVYNSLVKATVFFSIVDQDGATTLRDALVEKYGLTDEQRKLLEEEQKKAEKKGEEKKDGAKKEDDKKPKKNDKAKSVQIPPELIYHWTGKITSAMVYFKANAQRSAFEEIKLVKMDPALMRKLNERAKQEQEEALREKRKIDKSKLEF